MAAASGHRHRCLGFVVLCAAAATASSAAALSRVEASFNYAWRFHFGPEPDEAPGGPNNDPGFHFDVSNMTCSGMYPAPFRITPGDCSTSCAYLPDCYVWQQWGRSCRHGGANVSCGAQPANPGVVGARRTSVPPLRTDYTFSAEGYDDSGWELVDAPHDGILVPSNVVNSSLWPDFGYIPRTVLWYRKAFALPEGWGTDGSVIQLAFEGVQRFTQLWLNGVYLGSHDNGYAPFTVRLDNVSALRFGSSGTGGRASAVGPNVLALRADASFGSGHWYEGGGIRRSVSLVRTGPARFVDNGLFAVPELPTGAETHLNAVPLPVTAEFECLANATDCSGGGVAAKGVAVRFSLYAGDGQLLARNTSAVAALPAGAGVTAVASTFLTTDLSAPGALWGPATPTLYTVTAELLDVASGVVLDAVNSTSGFRRTVISPTTGLTVNGQPIKARGFSNHDSFASLGSALPPRIDLFRAQALRSLGGNWWRMSHNPYSTSTYAVLTALGVLAWDETRDFGAAYVQGMADMVKRDRNWPSIVMWSLCNEVECDAVDLSVGTAFADAARALDVSRPLAANSDSADGLYQLPPPFVQGWSHRDNSSFSSFHSQYPSIPLVLSECCSCTSQRLPPSSRDVVACIPDQNSPGLLPYSVGDLGVWTLMDYIGEAGSWPDSTSSFGQFDITGFPKPRAYWYRAAWLAGIPTSDPGRPPLHPLSFARVTDLLDQLQLSGGNTATLHAVVTAPAVSAELFVDGTSAGKSAVDGWMTTAEWTVTVPPAASSASHGIAPANCSFPNNLSGVQCKGLVVDKASSTAAACAAACCADSSCSMWQFAAGQGCWRGVSDDCSKAAPMWTGAGRPVPPVVIRNATVVSYDAAGRVVATGTSLGPSGSPSSIALSIDVPSPLTGTGSALLLDGVDVGLVRATLLDANGALVSTVPINITFSITSGPGVLVGASGGDPACHLPQRGAVASTYGGLARATVRVTVDCVSPQRDVILALDADPGAGSTPGTVTVLPSSTPCPTAGIVLTATAPGLPSVSITLPVSGDAAKDGVMAVAASAAALNVGGGAYLDSFLG